MAANGLFGIPLDEKQTRLNLSGEFTFVVPGLVKGKTNKDVVEAINKQGKKATKLYVKVNGAYLSIPIGGKIRLVKRAR